MAAAGTNGTERRVLAAGVAERALVEAHRNGVSADELIDAIREAARARDPQTFAEQP